MSVHVRDRESGRDHESVDGENGRGVPLHVSHVNAHHVHVRDHGHAVPVHVHEHGHNSAHAHAREQHPRRGHGHVNGRAQHVNDHHDRVARQQDWIRRNSSPQQQAWLHVHVHVCDGDDGRDQHLHGRVHSYAPAHSRHEEQAMQTQMVNKF